VNEEGGKIAKKFETKTHSPARKEKPRRRCWDQHQSEIKDSFVFGKTHQVGDKGGINTKGGGVLSSGCTALDPIEGGFLLFGARL